MDLIRLTANRSDVSETARAVIHTRADKVTGQEVRLASEAVATEEPLEIRLALSFLFVEQGQFVTVE